MRLEAKKYLYDIQQAASRIEEFTSGKQLDDYRRDPMMRSAVERQFEIIGEALSHLAKLDSLLVQRIREHRRIIDFRNVLIHGYAVVDDRLVWDIIESKLPALRRETQALLRSE